MYLWVTVQSIPSPVCTGAFDPKSEVGLQKALAPPRSLEIILKNMPIRADSISHCLCLHHRLACTSLSKGRGWVSLVGCRNRDCIWETTRSVDTRDFYLNGRRTDRPGVCAPTYLRGVVLLCASTDRVARRRACELGGFGGGEGDASQPAARREERAGGMAEPDEGPDSRCNTICRRQRETAAPRACREAGWDAASAWLPVCRGKRRPGALLPRGYGPGTSYYASTLGASNSGPRMRAASYHPYLER